MKFCTSWIPIFLPIFLLGKGIEVQGVEITVNSTSSPTLSSWVPKLRPAVKDYYTKASQYLSYPGYTPPQKLTITLDGTCEGLISSSDNKYTVCAKDLAQKKGGPTADDLNRILQTTTWSVMSYPPPPQAPDWLTQCTSVYVRSYIYEKDQSKRPSKPGADDLAENPSETSTLGCAYWLNQVNQKYSKKGQRDVVQQLFRVTREGKYNNKFWVGVTGKSKTKLWDEMMQQKVGHV